MKFLLALLLTLPVFAQTYEGVNGQAINVGIKKPLPTISLPISSNGLQLITIIGHNADIDAAADEEIWETGGLIVHLSTAETMDLVSTDAKDTDFAVGILTLSANASDTDTVTIGTKVYTFQTTLTNVDGNILIGTLATDSLDNIIAAITLGAGSGTLYAAATTEHPNVTAAAGAGDTMDATSEIGRNEAATTDDNANMSWGAVTLINGVGLRSVRVEGVNNSYIEISEVVSLNGITDAVTTLLFLRVNRLVGLRVGSENDNAGAITATATSAGDVQDHMKAADGISQNAHYTVPAGSVAYILNVDVFAIVAGGGATVVNFSGVIKEPGLSKQTIFTGKYDTAIKGGQSVSYSRPIPAQTDIFILGGTDVNNTIIDTNVQLLIVK